MFKLSGKNYHKSRTKPDVIGNCATSGYYNPAGVLQFSYGAGATFLKEHVAEEIHYSTRRRGSNSKVSNICIHKRNHRWYTGDGSPQRVNDIRAGFAGYYYLDAASHGLASDSHAVAVAAATTAFGVSLGTAELYANGLGYVNQTVQALSPDLTKLSVPNDLLDWKQLGELPKLWRSSESLVKNLAGAHLNYKFGWKPLIGDLTGLTKGLATLATTLKMFHELQGLTIGARKTLKNESIIKIGTSAVSTGWTVKWRGQADRTVVGFMAYAPKAMLSLGPVVDKLEQLLEIGGIELNPGIIWDAIPFSFVVDWFVNVGSFLDRFKSNTYDLPIQLLDTFVQYKERITIDSTPVHSDANTGTYQFPGSMTVSTCFHRLPLQPDPLTFQGLNWKSPTTNQWELGLSLGTVLTNPKLPNSIIKLAESGGTWYEY